MKKAISKSITLNENEWNKLSLLSEDKINKMVQSIVREYLNKNESKFIYDIFQEIKNVDFLTVDIERDRKISEKFEDITGETVQRVYDFSDSNKYIIFQGETFKVLKDNQNRLSMVYKTKVLQEEDKNIKEVF